MAPAQLPLPRARDNMQGAKALGALVKLIVAVEGTLRQMDDEGGEKAQSQATRLIELAEASDAVFFHDQLGDSYCATRGDGREVLKVRSRKFRLWLRQLMWQAEKKTPGGQGIEDALGHLDGEAIFAGEEIPLAVRVTWHENALWYDLGEEAIRITKDGWVIVPQPPILFKRFQANSPQVAPIKGGAVRDFLAFVRVKTARDQCLLLVQLVTIFLPGFPQAAQVISGDQGASKTTLQELFKSLVDPSIALTLSPPDSVKEFVQQASHHWVLFYDNLTSMPQWFSDGLCKAVTGQGFSKRELYSDDDDVVYAFRRVVGVNAINLVVERPDLLDRSLLIHLERIPDEERRVVDELWKAFEQAKPGILGGIFDVLAKALVMHPQLHLPRLPRMADFARWGEAISQAMGYAPQTFLKAYAENVSMQNEAAVEASPVAQALIAIMENRSEPWTGTPTALLETLLQVATDLQLNTKAKNWPKEPRWVWRRIKEVRPNLLALGIHATDTPDTRPRQIILTRTLSGNDDGDVGVDGATKNQGVRAVDTMRGVGGEVGDVDSRVDTANTTQHDDGGISLKYVAGVNTVDTVDRIPACPSDRYEEGEIG